MAFRIQDPVSGLFWKIDGTKIVLAGDGSEFAETAEGLVNVFLAGSYLYFIDRPISWKFTIDGFIQSGDFFIAPDLAHGAPVVSRFSTVWTKVTETQEPEPVAVPEPEPEAVEEEEDVPVARSAALIEEALNAKAAAPDTDEDEA
jgi:hypothetical protein